MAETHHNLAGLLFSDSRDFLLDSHGTQVKRDAIEGKLTVGLLIGPHWLPKALEYALSIIAEPYEELLKEGKPIIFIYVASDRDPELIETIQKYGGADDLDIDRPDAESFDDVVKKNLPHGWLYMPFDDVESRMRVVERFKTSIFSLCFFDSDGVLQTDQGLALLDKWGAPAYPFSADQINVLEQEAKQRLENQNLKVLLVHEDRDYLISSKESNIQVNVSDLEGKTVALYFSAHWCPPCQNFTPRLASVYDELKKQHADFEVIFISSDEDQKSFENYFKEMPWLALPYADRKAKKFLNDWFKVEGIPTLIILDGQGKTICNDATELVFKYGANAYPFTEEKLEQLRQEEEAKREAQTLESLLVTEERDYLLSRFEPVKIASLVGKTVGLYFSGHWCNPCRNFTPILAAAYDELKGRGEEFEIIFISGDQDQESFDEYYDTMPWLALPFEDVLRGSLAQYFNIETIPQLVIIGADGKTINANATQLISLYGADSFPFTEERVIELQKQTAEKDLTLPKDVHPHPNVVSEYEDKGSKNGDSGVNSEYSCDGDVCRKI